MRRTQAAISRASGYIAVFQLFLMWMGQGHCSILRHQTNKSINARVRRQLEKKGGIIVAHLSAELPLSIHAVQLMPIHGKLVNRVVMRQLGISSESQRLHHDTSHRILCYLPKPTIHYDLSRQCSFYFTSCLASTSLENIC